MSDITFSAGRDESNSYCKAKSYSSLKVDENDCNTALGMAINGCTSQAAKFRPVIRDQKLTIVALKAIQTP